MGTYEVYATLHGDKVGLHNQNRAEDDEAPPEYSTTRSFINRPDSPHPGGQGYPNEIRLLKNATDLAARSYLTPVIMRLYGRDPTMDTHDFDHRVWGGVAPPKVEYLGADGKWVEVRTVSCGGEAGWVL